MNVALLKGLKWILIFSVLSLPSFPALLFCEDIDVSIKGIDDGIKTSKQKDYMEALMNAKLQAIERAGVEIAAITKVENFELKYDMVESKAKAILLPGFQIMDIGYQADGTYVVILVGKVKSSLAAKEGEKEYDAALAGIRKFHNLVETGVTYRKYTESLPEMTLAIKNYAKAPGNDRELAFKW